MSTDDSINKIENFNGGKQSSGILITVLQRCIYFINMHLNSIQSERELQLGNESRNNNVGILVCMIVHCNNVHFF